MAEAPRCQKWDIWDWVSPGGTRYRASNGANEDGMMVYAKGLCSNGLKTWQN